MYAIRSEFDFEAAHNLKLSYESKCENLHGHSYHCAVTVESPELDENGMICDFTVFKKLLKERIEDKLDHKYLNEVYDVNATAEYMSKWIYDEVNSGLAELGVNAKCKCVELNETARNKAMYYEV